MRIDAYLVLTPVGAALDGESDDSIYSRAIEIADFKAGGGQGVDDNALPTNTRKQGRNYCPFGFEVTKEVDTASPHLFRAYCETFSRRFVPDVNRFKKAEVSFRKAGGTDGTTSGTVYLTMVFSQVILTSYALGAAADGRAAETVKFAFQSCQLQYQEQTPAGAAQPPKEMKGWDYFQNKPT